MLLIYIKCPELKKPPTQAIIILLFGIKQTQTQTKNQKGNITKHPVILPPILEYVDPLFITITPKYLMPIADARIELFAELIN